MVLGLTPRRLPKIGLACHEQIRQAVSAQSAIRRVHAIEHGVQRRSDALPGALLEQSKKDSPGF